MLGLVDGLIGGVVGLSQSVVVLIGAATSQMDEVDNVDGGGVGTTVVHTVVSNERGRIGGGSR